MSDFPNLSSKTPSGQAEPRDAREILADAVLNAHATFADMEKAYRLLRREALANACCIAKDAMKSALIEAGVIPSCRLVVESPEVSHD